MHARSRGRVALGQESVRRLSADAVVEARPPVARTRRRRRRQRHRGQRGPQIEPGAPDDERRPAGGQDLVDRLVRESLVLADRDLAREVEHAHEPGRLVRCCGQNGETAVKRRRIGGDDLGGYPVGERRRNGRLARRGRAEDRKDARKSRRRRTSSRSRCRRTPRAGPPRDERHGARGTTRRRAGSPRRAARAAPSPAARAPC